MSRSNSSARPVEGGQRTGGTGKRAQIKGVDVAGKTGTAQFWREENGGRQEKDNHTWFICLRALRGAEVCDLRDGAGRQIRRRRLRADRAEDSRGKPRAGKGFRSRTCSRSSPRRAAFAQIEMVDYKKSDVPSRCRQPRRPETAGPRRRAAATDRCERQVDGRDRTSARRPIKRGTDRASALGRSDRRSKSATFSSGFFGIKPRNPHHRRNALQRNHFARVDVDPSPPSAQQSLPQTPFHDRTRQTNDRAWLPRQTGNKLIINCEKLERRVALLENGVLEEYSIERADRPQHRRQHFQRPRQEHRARPQGDVRRHRLREECLPPFLGRAPRRARQRHRGSRARAAAESRRSGSRRRIFRAFIRSAAKCSCR